MKCYREISTTVGITIGYLTSLSRCVRRARLFYLRDRVGKAAKVKERI